MATREWILVPCLQKLTEEFNDVAPKRDRASDGSIADALHSSSSDHTPDEVSDALRRKDSDNINEVHAKDIDKDFRQPGLSMEMVVQFLLARCRSGAEKRLRYIIFNRRIWEASNGWRQRNYTGANAHDQHAHFSATYDTKLEYSRASWGIEEEFGMALSAEDKTWIRTEISKAVSEAVDGLPKEVVDALTKQTALKMEDRKTDDGTFSTPIGHNALSQGVPDPFRTDGKRSPFHVVVAEMAKRIKGMTDGPANT